MIGYYRLSLIGTSHSKKDGGVCQDSSNAELLRNGWVVAAVADGLGSSKHSDDGSRIAVNEIVNFVVSHTPDSWEVNSLTSLLREAYNSAVKQIKDKAYIDGNPESDYATTLTSVIYNGRDCVFGHVGDGGIITLNNSGALSLLTEAQKGEEFNSTVALIRGKDRWSFGSSYEPVAALLLLTDGIYDRICHPLLAEQEQRIWVNPARGFLDNTILNLHTAEDFNWIQNKIQNYLKGQNPVVMSITDDKTIIGIINTDVTPAILSDSYYAEPNFEKLYDDRERKLRCGKDTSPGTLDSKSIDTQSNQPSDNAATVVESSSTRISAFRCFLDFIAKWFIPSK